MTQHYWQLWFVHGDGLVVVAVIACVWMMLCTVFLYDPNKVQPPSRYEIAGASIVAALLVLFVCVVLGGGILMSMWLHGEI